MAILLLADHDQGKLAPATSRLVSALASLGPVDLLVTDPAVAPEAAALAGIARVRTAPAEGTEALTALLASLAPDYTHIAASAAAVGRDVIPRLAATLDLMPVTDVVAVLGPDRFQRPIYAGNAVETVRSPQSQHLLTLRPSAFAPAASGNAAPIEPVTSPGVTALARLLADNRSEGARPDLGTARIVIGGGVSLGSAENFHRLESLADRLGAAIGATRAAVDAGYAPNDWQVGQTGKVIAPELYIAFGISGALQHLAGIGGAKTIVAINTDAEAPLMKTADLTLIADLFATLDALDAELTRLGVTGG